MAAGQARSCRGPDRGMAAKDRAQRPVLRACGRARRDLALAGALRLAFEAPAIAALAAVGALGTVRSRGRVGARHPPRLRGLGVETRLGVGGDGRPDPLARCVIAARVPCLGLGRASALREPFRRGAALGGPTALPLARRRVGGPGLPRRRGATAGGGIGAFVRGPGGGTGCRRSARLLGPCALGRRPLGGAWLGV